VDINKQKELLKLLNLGTFDKVWSNSFLVNGALTRDIITISCCNNLKDFIHKIQVFWVRKLKRGVIDSKRFERMQYLHLQGSRSSQRSNI